MNFCRIYSSRGYTFYIVVVYVVPPVLLFTYIILEYLDFSSLTGWSVSNIFFGVMVNDVLSSLLYTRYEKGSLFVVYMVVYTTSFTVFLSLDKRVRNCDQRLRGTPLPHPLLEVPWESYVDGG